MTAGLQFNKTGFDPPKKENVLLFVPRYVVKQLISNL